jgi:hypothetical protein
MEPVTSQIQRKAALIRETNNKKIEADGRRVLLMKNTQLFVFGAIFACFFVTQSADASAQAYVNQVSQGEREAYVTQTPPTARPVAPPVAAPRKTATLGAKTRVRASLAALHPFPSVGRGSSAIVSTGADVAEWPSVGRGAINR